VEEVVRRMSDQEPVRIPKKVLEELESVRRYTRVNVLDIPTIRHVAMEMEKAALVLWIDEHEQEYGQGLLHGFRAED
jgi:type IV secretory pathway ATPase VirB11/archaellum biosynthesis ATPase